MEKDKIILIDPKKNRISIPRKNILCIGNPSHILLLVNPEERTLIVSQGDESDKRSNRVPLLKGERNREVELYSKSLIQSILSITKRWQDGFAYRTVGEYIPSENILRFYIDELRPFVRGRKC